ncbi:TetR/AcrR family transcriptional regulator [Bdellovibrio sp. 22V]|uniref:TetR/AcrR family transcriptional regulator n=1 Tax=Bdellovibrio TaxID=958 RepID=UPI0025438BB7|nr:TetR/AcrR family transcriptional regulator [Bdellovibrio sp. 22V]WII71092.1 TetR/AcrR family transcriptional regulator [Bdellovibrio sp. 22V]
MDTRSRALSLARNYLQTLGFNGFSFQTIADSLGIRKASLHYYFASKEDMGLAVLEDYAKAYTDWSLKVADLPAAKRIEKMFEMFNKMAADNSKICPLGALCSDYNTLPKGIRKKVLEFHILQRKWLIKTLKQGIEEKSIRKDVNLEATADLLLTSIQGGLLVARLRGEAETFKNANKALMKTFML